MYVEITKIQIVLSTKEDKFFVCREDKLLHRFQQLKDDYRYTLCKEKDQYFLDEKKKTQQQKNQSYNKVLLINTHYICFQGEI